MTAFLKSSSINLEVNSRFLFSLVFLALSSITFCLIILSIFDSLVSMSLLSELIFSLIIIFNNEINVVNN